MKAGRRFFSFLRAPFLPRARAAGRGRDFRASFATCLMDCALHPFFLRSIEVEPPLSFPSSAPEMENKRLFSPRSDDGKVSPLSLASPYLRYLSRSGEKCCREKKGGKGAFCSVNTKVCCWSGAGKGGWMGQWTESKSERWGRQGSWLVAIVCVPPFLRFGMCDECPGTTSLCGLLFCRFRSPISSLILSCSSLPPTPLCLWRPCRARYVLYAHTAQGLVRREGEE